MPIVISNTKSCRRHSGPGIFMTRPEVEDGGSTLRRLAGGGGFVSY
jgi:hypothetical protein